MTRLCKLIVVLYAFCGIGLRLNAQHEILGISEPGTTQWSNEWYGTISNVLPLDYDVLPVSVSVDTLRANAYVTFMHTAPYIRKVSVSNLMIDDVIRWHHSLGAVLASTQIVREDRTLFLTRQINHSFLVQTANTTDTIIRADRIDCVAAKPLVYSSSSRCIFFGDETNRRTIHRYCPEHQQLTSRTIDGINTHVSGMVADADGNNIYVLSYDLPGDIIQISADTFEETGRVTLPGNLRGLQVVSDADLDRLIVVAEDSPHFTFSIVQILLNPLTTGIVQPMLPDETAVVPAGICSDALVMAVAENNTSRIVRFDRQNLLRLDSVNCSDAFGHAGMAAVAGGTVIVVDNSTPAAIESFCCETMTLLGSERFPGADGWLYGMAINPLHQVLMVSKQGVDPATLLLVDLETFLPAGRVEYTLNDDGWFLLLEQDLTGDYTYGYHSGTPDFLVRICNETFLVDKAKALNLSAPADTILVDDSSGSLFMIYGMTLARFDLNTLELLDQLILDSPPAGTLKALMPDDIRDRLIVGNSAGKVYGIAKSPLNIVDETVLTETQGTITSGIILPDKNISVFALYNGTGVPASLIELDLTTFLFHQHSAYEVPEVLVKCMLYDSNHSVINTGIYDYFGGIVTFSAPPLVRLNNDNLSSFYRFVTNAVLKLAENLGYWSNSFKQGKIAKTSNHGDGYMAGSRVVLDEPARIHSLSFYSHVAEGSVRLAVYNNELQKLWESAVIENLSDEDWLVVPVDSGTPASLALYPGEYWLMFQSGGTTRVASAHPGDHGEGIRQAAAFGTFPDHLWFSDSTSDRWAFYAEWSPLFPTATPTPSPTPSPTPTMPSATQTPEPSLTPTPAETPEPSRTPTPAQDTPVPTESPSPTDTPEPSPTPKLSGVELLINSTVFKPNDVFSLTALVTPPNTPEPLSLWVILDVYGSYWFGPAWTQTPDCYMLPELTEPHSENILYFVWPRNAGSASGLAFWGAILNAETNELVGQFDKVYFEYQP